MTFEPQVIDAVVMIDDEIIATVEDNSNVFDAETNVVVVHEYDEHYVGDYTVTPKAFDTTTLETKDKVMDDNVLVLEVPYHETYNGKGITIYIASEV